MGIYIYIYIYIGMDKERVGERHGERSGSGAHAQAHTKEKEKDLPGMRPCLVTHAVQCWVVTKAVAMLAEPCHCELHRHLRTAGTGIVREDAHAIDIRDEVCCFIWAAVLN